MDLIRFMQGWNTTLPKLQFSEDTLNWYVNGCEVALKDAYTVKVDDDNTRKSGELRISSLGKPGIVQALTKLGVVDRGYNNDARFSARSMFPLYLGNVIESTVMSMMFAAGVDIHDLQKEVDFHGVKGHIDALYGNEAVIDVKSMSRPYFDKFTLNPTDDRGYITQLLCYAAACDVPFAYVICVDKQFGEMDIVKLDDDTLPLLQEDYIRRAMLIIDIMSGIDTVEKALDAFEIPPLQEGFGKQRTFAVPEELRYGVWKKLFYEMTKPSDPWCTTARGLRPREEVLALVSALLPEASQQSQPHTVDKSQCAID